MSNWLLALTGCIYLGVAIDYFIHKNPGMALSFVAYALANVGFILSNVQTLSNS
jgi:hypothetical protein